MLAKHRWQPYHFFKVKSRVKYSDLSDMPNVRVRNLNIYCYVSALLLRKGGGTGNL